MGIRGFESDIIENYHDGVITSIPIDNLPANAMALGRNTKFHNIGPGIALQGTRDGFAPQNEEQLVDGKMIDNLHFFKTEDAHSVLFTTNDDNVLGSLYNWDGAAATLIGAEGDFTKAFWSFINVNNFAYGVNGNEKIKTDGLNWWVLGIDRPASAVFTAAAQALGTNLPAGDYDVLITYFNADTGHEGPRSNDTITVTIAGGEQLRVVLPGIATIGDSQVTHARIYIRQQAASNQFFSVVAGATPAVDSENAFALDATLTTTVDIDATQDEIDAFITLAPGANDNLVEPVSPFRFIVSYRQRVIACDLFNIYWTDIGRPEGFNTEDNTLPVGLRDGERITGMAVHDDTLIIFKRNQTFYLDGDDPETWVIRTLDPTYGNISPKSFGVQDGYLYFLSLIGPQRWARGKGIEDITTKLLTEQFDPQHVNNSLMDESLIVTDQKNGMVGWVVPVISESASVHIIPFSTQTDRWMSNGWDCLDFTAVCSVVGDDGVIEPLYGDAYGNLYVGSQAAADGVPGSVTITSQALLSHVNTLTEIKPDIDADSDTLVGRYIWIWQTDNDGSIIDAVKRRITANVANVLTLADDLPTIPDTDTETWHYALGGIYQDQRTGFRAGGNTFYRKRIEYVFLEFTTAANITDMTVQVFKDRNSLTPIMTAHLSFEDAATGPAASSSDWDEAVWDESIWDATGSNSGLETQHIKRIPVHVVGHSWQTRLVFMATGGLMLPRRIGMQWLSKTKKAER